MRAVVVEIKNNYAALLQDDGIIVKKKNENYKIGDVVTVREKSITKKFRFAVAAAVFFSIIGVGAAAYTTPYYYVSLDVNPGIILKANLFERVIGAEGDNEDGKAIVEKLNLKNKEIETAVRTAVDEIKQKGYFDENNNIVVAASARNNEDAEQLAQELEDVIENEVQDENIKADVDCKGIGYEMVKKAREHNITPGKYNIITHLLDEEVNDVNKNESIKELMTRYHAKKDADKNKAEKHNHNKDKKYEKNNLKYNKTEKKQYRNYRHTDRSRYYIRSR